MEQANLKQHLEHPSNTPCITIRTIPGRHCGTADCAYVTQERTLEQQIQLLPLHTTTDHPAPRQAGAGRPTRTILELESSEEIFQFWKTKWATYKDHYNLEDTSICGQLMACLSRDLQIKLHHSMGATLDTASEESILAMVKYLAVQLYV